MFTLIQRPIRPILFILILFCLSTVSYAQEDTLLYHAPATAIYSHGAQEQLYVFVSGPDGKLWIRFWDKKGTASLEDDEWVWHREYSAPVGTRVASAPSVITPYTNIGSPFPYTSRSLIIAFVRGDDNHVWLYAWDQEAWQWQDAGSPQGDDATSAPAAITFWQNRPLDPSLSQPTVEATCQGPPTDQVAVFVRGRQSPLYSSHLATWEAIALPFAFVPIIPPQPPLIGAPAAYFDRGSNRIFAAATAYNGLLYTSTATNSYMVPCAYTPVWQQWHLHRTPTASTLLSGTPAISTYSVNGEERVYVFVRDTDGDLHEIHWAWEGSRGWEWGDNLGTLGAGIEVVSRPVVHAFGERLYVFVTASNGNIYEGYLQGETFQWESDPLPMPQGVTAASAPAATTYDFQETEQFYVFYMGSNGQLYEVNRSAARDWLVGEPHGIPPT